LPSSFLQTCADTAAARPLYLLRAGAGPPSQPENEKDKIMTLKDILPSKLGFGAAPLGNMFRDIPEAEALTTVGAAWNDGIRYFDNAPFYGAGLAEIRMGEALAGKPRDEYVISTKVGRIILDEIEDTSARDLGEKGDVFKYGRANKIVNDYSEDATYRSIEDSLRRLKTDRIDIAFVHDVAQDFYGDEWLGVFESARKGAFRALDRLRDEGVIKAWGLGVNRVEPIEPLLALDGPRPDGFLLAGRYTLLDHDRSLQRVMPTAAERGLGIVVGGPYSSGALVGGPNFEYAPAAPQILDRVARIKAIADRYGISVKAAGLQFALAHPAVDAVIPGASKPGRITEDRAALAEQIPTDFWREIRQAGLVNPQAPLPTME
jgi:D-threo-aldose 1-dehydrogenase